jgi:hypothetical protein
MNLIRRPSPRSRPTIKMPWSFTSSRTPVLEPTPRTGVSNVVRAPNPNRLAYPGIRNAPFCPVHFYLLQQGP